MARRPRKQAVKSRAAGAKAAGVRVRPAKPADVPVIKTMIREFVEYLNAIDEPEEPNQAAIDRIAGAVFGKEPLCRILIAEADGRTAGYLVYYIGLDMDLVLPAAYVVDLFIREAHRKRGGGRALMEAAGEIVKRRGGSTLFWTVWRKNPKALAFYRHLGARPWDEEILMRWSLDGRG
jgi:GNAT superfamily N-acetyltransferase